MEEMLFASLSITEAQARQSMAKPDWPQPDSSTAKEWSSDLLWVPIDRLTGEPKTSLSAYPGLSILTFDPMTIDTCGRQASPDPPGSGSVMAPERKTRITYMPVWYMSRGESPGSWVAINGCNGKTVAGDLEAHPSAAFSHLIFYLVLALFCCYWGSDIAINIINAGLDGSVSLYRSVSGCQFISLPFAFFLGMGGIGASALLVAAAYRFFPFLLQEPLCRIITGRIMLPQDITKGRLLQGAAYVAIGEALMNIVLLMTMKDLTPAKTLFIMGDLVISLVFCIVAFKCASELGSYTPSIVTGGIPGKAVIPSGAASDLVITLIYIALGSVAGTMAAHVLLHSGLWGVFLRAWAPDPRDFLSIGAEIGAFIAIIPAPLAAVYRIPLIIGALSSKLGDIFIGDWGSLSITLVTVAVSTFLVSRQGGRIIEGELWHSVRASWSFSLFGTMGILAGRLIAIFMLGIYADKLGEAVGGIISSLAGLMASEQSWQKEIERRAGDGR